MKASQVALIIGIALAVAGAPHPCAADPPGWTITQLTDNSDRDSDAHVSVSHVVWCGSDGSDDEIFLYDIAGGTTTQLTDNSERDCQPRIWGSHVVWCGYDESDAEVFLYDITSGTTTQVTDNADGDYDPHVSSSHVVWRRSGGPDEPYDAIFVYDIATGTTTQATDDGTLNYSPQLSGGNVVWQRYDGQDWEIVLYDIATGTTTQLTDNSEDDSGQQISGPHVVWRGYDGADWEIFLYDITTRTTTQLTDNAYADYAPRVSGSLVVWYGYDDASGGDAELFIYDTATGTTTNLTDNSDDDYDPQIAGLDVAWHAYDGAGGGDAEIFLYDIAAGTPTRFTDDAAHDGGPQVSASRVVWHGHAAGGSELEIFLAVPDALTDTTAPVDGAVTADTGPFTNDTSQLVFSWRWFDDPESGIDHYEMAFGNESDPEAYQPFTPVGTATSHTFLPGDFPAHFPGGVFPEATYLCTVRAVNAAGLTSPGTSGPVTVDLVAPTATVTEVTPDPRYAPVAAVELVFSEPIRNFDVGDITLTLDGGTNLLTGTETLTSADDISWTLDGLSGLTYEPGLYELTLNVSDVQDRAGNALLADATETWTILWCTLTATATTGGTITAPGAGSHDYYHGTAVPLEAAAEPGYWFLKWTGTAVDAGKVYDPTSASTTITMDADYTIQANFGQIMYVDDDAPDDPGPGDPTVSDPLEDGTPAHPYDTIQEAMDMALDRCKVIVLAGTYTGEGNRDLDFAGKTLLVESTGGARDTIIDCENAGRGFHLHSGQGPDTVIDGFTITNGLADFGGAISCVGASPTITNCTLTRNAADVAGGIYCEDSTALITNCIITRSTALAHGGGIYSTLGSPTIVNCTVNGNTAGADGGGITLDATGATMAHCTVSGNTATGNGGGMACLQASTPTLLDCIVWGNSGQPIFVDDPPWPVVAYSCIQDSDPDDAHVHPGTGNIDDDPLLVPGPLHDSYLSRLGAGQVGNSPCMDAGSDTAPNLGLDALTTRTDGLPDSGIADMGFHSPPAVPGDVDGNKIVDGLDYSAVIGAWMTTPGHPLWNRNADLDRTNIVDGLDLSLVLSHWTVWGDVDGNRVVDGMDLAAVIAAWMTTPDDPLWNPDSDINRSGVVDGLDLSIVLSNWTNQ